jgi:DNA-binding CsgD family transcriptional regulator
MFSTLRVQLAFPDPDDDDAWLEALDPIVLVVESDPDVVLARGEVEVPAGVPVVWVATGERAVGSWVSADTEPEVVAAALWAASLGLAVSSHRAVEDGTPPLTPREREVLELLAVGLSNREIGQALQISAHTAKFHVQGVLEKLDATSRTEAAVRAARRLWI